MIQLELACYAYSKRVTFDTCIPAHCSLVLLLAVHRVYKYRYGGMQNANFVRYEHESISCLES